MILQGPPGTGKTWPAKKLAFALVGARSRSRVRPLQFHPNLSYEDFVRGWRPSGGTDGRLELVDGPFLKAVADSENAPDRSFVVVIEEINRGNPAQVFGEMLTLLEADKRTPAEALALSFPLRNIWLLMLYASKLYRDLPSRLRHRAEENPDDIADLVAEILTRAVELRTRRNLTLEFHRRQADLSRVRGRIDVFRTERRSFLRQGKVACSFEELTTDTPRNRLVKAALKKLGRSVRDERLSSRCRNLSAALDRAGVGDESPAGLRSGAASRSASATARPADSDATAGVGTVPAGL